MAARTDVFVGVRSGKRSNMRKSNVKTYKGIGMNGFIARWYARNAAKSINDYARDARRVAALLPSGGRVLEVASGPGYQAIEFAKLGGYAITGVDISESFVRIASDNARAAGVDVEFRSGNASDLPFSEGKFNLVYCRAAFKNFAEPVLAIEEMYRVLRSEGVAVIQDLRPDAPERAISEAVAGMNLGRVNAWVTRWIFRHLLLRRAYTREQLEAMVGATPFGSCEVREESLAYEVAMRKRFPLDEWRAAPATGRRDRDRFRRWM
jgi:ubiquinone/menaquinone biosynthesis C-methylase UbiE